MSTPPLEFIREPKYDAQLQTLAESNARMDELDMAIEWVLMRRPEGFYNVAKDYYI
jgi:hypothetical protein